VSAGLNKVRLISGSGQGLCIVGFFGEDYVLVWLLSKQQMDVIKRSGGASGPRHPSSIIHHNSRLKQILSQLHLSFQPRLCSLLLSLHTTTITTTTIIIPR